MFKKFVEDMKRKRRTLAKLRFKSLVRKVMVNTKWLSELEDQRLGDNVRRNVQIIVRRKGVKGLLSLADKRILNTPLEERTIVERERILNVITGLKCFKRYPPVVRSRLAKTAQFLYFNRGRTIVRQNHHASALYFILEGEITVLQLQYSAIDNKFINVPVGAMQGGDMFGEVALLYNTKRTATCQTATDCELLCIYQDDFDRIIKPTLKTQWDQILLALKRFEYFKNWTNNQIQECCVLSRIKQYDQQQTIYSDDKGVLHYVHFVLSGKCMILQCLEMNTTNENNTKTYTLASMEKRKSKSEEIIEKLQMSVEHLKTIQSDPQLIIQRISNQTLNLPNEIIENASNYDFSNSSELPNISSKIDTNLNVEHSFVDVGTFSCGSVFALGENMEHRTIVARNQVQCLLIPRYWLFEKAQNIGNIWYRTKMYLDSSIPSRLEIFNDFLATAKWINYKKKVVRNLTSTKINRNHTTLRDVPMICRIEEGL